MGIALHYGGIARSNDANLRAGSRVSESAVRIFVKAHTTKTIISSKNPGNQSRQAGG